jgi:hypothetical protein
MMARKGWSDLSDSYRGRLERGGIDRESYNAGASLAGARGHGATPERPERAERDQERYQDYLQRREALEREVRAQKTRDFGSSDKWRADRSKRNVQNMPGSMRNMQRYLDAGGIEGLMSYDDFDWSDREWAFLYYH